MLKREDLFNAVEEGDIKKVQEFIEKGIDVNLKDEDEKGFPGESALYKATEKGHVDIVKLLIDKGADVNSENFHHETALFEACYNCNLEIVRVLVDNGARINAKMKDGKTPIMYAVRAAHSKYLISKSYGDANIANIIGIIKILLEKGADINAKEKAGKTALTYANEYRLSPIIDLLKNVGAEGIDRSAFAPKANVTINCDINAVWAFLITEANWSKWHGPVPKVEPKWQENAILVWPNGDESTISGFKPNQELVTESSFIRQITRLRTISSNSTVLEMIVMPMGGATFSDGGAAHKRTIEDKLMKLKNSIEKGKHAKQLIDLNNSSAQQERKPWWKFW